MIPNSLEPRIISSAYLLLQCPSIQPAPSVIILLSLPEPVLLSAELENKLSLSQIQWTVFFFFFLFFFTEQYTRRTFFIY